jgi:pyrimidine-nucleoside phosphorylase
MGTPMRAVLTAMDQPLGRTVGNAVEVAESIACLRNAGPADTMEVTYVLGEQMLVLCGKARTPAEARSQLRAVVENGRALEKFRELVTAQGGDARVLDDPARLPQARLVKTITSTQAGVVASVDAMGIALAALKLGAGRSRAEDTIDHAVGVSALAKVGETVAAGDRVAVLHANSEAALADAEAMLRRSLEIGPGPVPVPALVDEIIG